MRKRTLLRAAAASALVCTAGLSLFGATAGASTLFKGHGATIPLDFSSNPNTTLEPPPPLAPLDLSSCPFDATATFSVTGNVVAHETENKNGGWFGETVEGTATFTTASAVYVGHISGWAGFGSNQSLTDLTGQSEGGLQMTFHGTNVASATDTLTVQIGWHYTENDAGSVTSMNEGVSCTA